MGFFVEVLERRVQTLEAIEVFEYCFHRFVNNVFINSGGRNEGCRHTESFDIFVVTTVKATRNHRTRVVGVLFDQTVDFVTGHRDQTRINGGGRFLDRAVRVAYHVHGIALARTRVTDVDALAWEIADVLDTGIRAGHHGQRLTVHGEDGTHIFPSALFFKVGFTVVSAVLNVRLHNAHIQLTALHAVDVSNGTTGRRGVTTDVVLIAATVNHAAYRLANHIVNTGLAAGTDGDVALLSNGRRGKGCRCN